MWNAIIELVNEIKRCEKAGATTAAVAMAFICIDTMAILSLPPERNKQSANDFIVWVNTYLKGHEDQPYQYRGIDVYGARCALLHAFGSEVYYHKKKSDAKKYGYHDGGMHIYDPAEDEFLVIIGTASFLDDVVHSVEAFLETCKVDSNLLTCVECRLPNMLATFPIKT
jgi:hypothetical protein